MGQREIYQVLPDNEDHAIDTPEICRRISELPVWTATDIHHIRRGLRILIKCGEVRRKPIPHKNNGYYYWRI